MPAAPTPIVAVFRSNMRRVSLWSVMSFSPLCCPIRNGRAASNGKIRWTTVAGIQHGVVRGRALVVLLSFLQSVVGVRFAAETA
jgi:hypothetical protein